MPYSFLTLFIHYFVLLHYHIGIKSNIIIYGCNVTTKRSSSLYLNNGTFGVL